jgi:hypothetical protein
VKQLGIGSATDLPDVNGLIPSPAIRAVFMIVGVLLSFVVYRTSGWLEVGIVFAVAAVLFPQYLLGWGLILYLAIGELAHRAELSWRFLVLLAGLHLLHVLAMWVLELPWRSKVQIAMFVPGLLRYLAIQVPVQVLAVLALLLLAPNANGHRPLTIAGCAVIGAAALIGLAVRLTRPLREDNQSPSREGGSRRSA